MSNGLVSALAVTAAGVGAFHSLAPDHWVPLAAIARVQKWSGGRTTRVTLLCGLGHVTCSVALGFLGLFLGVAVLEHYGRRLESLAGVLLVLFGAAYATLGLRRAAGRRFHGHTHAHYDHVHAPERATVWSLFVLYSADPCVAVIPLLVAAAPLGLGAAAIVAVVYEVATIATMLALVLPARSGARVLSGRWVERYGDVWAGCAIVATGVATTLLGW